MTVRGTRNLFGAEAEALHSLIARLELGAVGMGYRRFTPSLLAERVLFEGQMGDNRVFELRDPSARDLVLIPEVTAIVRQEYRESWSKQLPKPVRLFYTSRCYRYDRPQRGRYREFTQFGVEYLGPARVDDGVQDVLRACLASAGLTRYEIQNAVKRGLGYYIEDGFEVHAAGMQLVGGGRYKEGNGWALGVERLLLAREAESSL